MARVTVEDCVDKVPKRFELVLLAAHRARAISNGSPITLERENDKNPVVALREIADQTVPAEDMKEGLIHSIQIPARGILEAAPEKVPSITIGVPIPSARIKNDTKPKRTSPFLAT